MRSKKYWMIIAGLALVAQSHSHAAGAPSFRTIEEYLQSLTTVPSIAKRRDPFFITAPPAELEDPAANKMVISDSPLQNHPLTAYELVATLIGDIYSRALVKAPDGKVLIVKERDKIGNRGGFVTKITQSTLEVMETERNAMGFDETAVRRLNVRRKE